MADDQVTKEFSDRLEKEINQYGISDNQTIAEKNIFNDLEVFEGNEDINKSIFNVINKTKTVFGSIYINNMLSIPIKDIDVLKTRQNILNKIT